MYLSICSKNKYFRINNFDAFSSNIWRSFRRRREAWWCRTVCSRWAEMFAGGFVGVTGVIRWAPPIQHSVLSAHHPTDYPEPEVESPPPPQRLNVSQWFLYCHSPVLYVWKGQMFYSVKNVWRCSPPLASSETWTERISLSLQVFPVL